MRTLILLLAISSNVFAMEPPPPKTYRDAGGTTLNSSMQIFARQLKQAMEEIDEQKLAHDKQAANEPENDNEDEDGWLSCRSEQPGFSYDHAKSQVKLHFDKELLKHMKAELVKATTIYKNNPSIIDLGHGAVGHHTNPLLVLLDQGFILSALYLNHLGISAACCEQLAIEGLGPMCRETSLGEVRQKMLDYWRKTYPNQFEPIFVDYGDDDLDPKQHDKAFSTFFGNAYHFLVSEIEI